MLAVYGPKNPGKIERHVKPLADEVETTLVCIDRGDEFEDLNYRTVPTFGLRPIGLALMLVVAFQEAIRGDYDGIVSFSLFPHGCIALAVGRRRNLPVHLGVLGMDLDVHAQAAYGPAVAWLLRRFDVVSVPGTNHREQLEELGLPPERTAILTNAIETDRFVPHPATDQSYDCCWVGRFGPEKRPELFVKALARLAAEGRSIRAVMLGDGERREAVRDLLNYYDLEEMVDRPGWVDDPLPYYRQSKTFVLTSRREGLPLTLVEAMATGTAPVTVDVGSVKDVAEDGHNAVVVPPDDVEALADGIGRLLDDSGARRRLADNAEAVRSDCGYDAATEDWRRILDAMGFRSMAEPTPDQRVEVA